MSVSGEAEAAALIFPMNNVRRLKAALLTALLAFGNALSADESETATSGLYEALTGGNLAKLPVLKALDLTLGGWVSMGITYNNYSPGDHSNGTVTFNDRSSEFQLNQLNLFLERAVDKDSKRWSIGGRLDFMFGTDSRFTQAEGNWDQNLITQSTWRFYDIALPQAYVEVATPFLRGATVKIGHFYTILGYEVVPAPNNFFYSHAYAMQYGEPFTHTGALINYPISSSITANVGAVTGPTGKSDNFQNSIGNWNFLGGLNWASEDGATAFSGSVTSGGVDENGNDNRTIGGIVLNRDLTEKLHYVFQYDHGYQDGAAPTGGPAQWYGINQYLIYALADTVSMALRGEWFRDQTGFRVSGYPASYYETTLGINWKPHSWIIVRTEARYDWMDGPFKVFDENRRSSQLTIGTNAVIGF